MLRCLGSSVPFSAMNSLTRSIQKFCHFPGAGGGAMLAGRLSEALVAGLVVVASAPSAVETTMPRREKTKMPARVRIAMVANCNAQVRADGGVGARHGLGFSPQ